MPPTVGVWNNRNFTRYWTGRVVTRFGSAVSQIVLIWIAFTETGSVLSVTYVGLAQFVPTIAIGIFTGALVDRLDRRRLIVVTVLARSAAMGALAIALFLLGFHLSFVLLASVVFAVFSTFFGPGSQALLPEIVAPESLADANGLSQSSEEIVGVVGSSLAGVLIVVVGAVPSLGIDAVCYLVGAVCVLLIATTVTAPHPVRPRAPLLTEVREGFAYLRSNVGLLEVTLSATVLNFLSGFLLTYLVVFATGPLRGGAEVYAGLEAALSVGIAVGAVLVGRMGLTRYAGRLWVYAGFVQGGALAVVVLFPNVVVAFVGAIVWGVLNGVINVAWLSSVQALVPERMQGRYYSIDNMLSWAAIPVAQILGGFLILAEGISITFLVAGVGSILVGFACLGLKELRKFGYDPKSARPLVA